MLNGYNYGADERQLPECVQKQQWETAFEMLAEPLHVALYEARSFDLLDTLSPAERLVLSFDYVQAQVGQGGFIQLIQNGYVSLLVTVIEALQMLGTGKEMIAVLDDALKVFVLNKDTLNRETSVEAFGKLYEAFPEFEVLDSRFYMERQSVVVEIVKYICGKNIS